MIEFVLKIGGSLGRGTKLKPLCQRLAELGRKRRILVVPGGGAFADMVRDYHSRYELSDSAAHWMAILAMDQFGHALADLIPDGEPVRGLAAARETAAAGRVPVLNSFDLLFRVDPLERSWRVTSDSIAAWVAEQVGARTLVLLKSVDGLYTSDPHAGGNPELIEDIGLDQLAACDGVDSYLPRLLSGSALKLWIINGEHPDRLTELLKKGRTKGTRVRTANFSGAGPFADPPGH